MRSLTARGSFDSLIFYQDLILDPEDFCFIRADGGLGMRDGGGLFWSFIFLKIIWYIPYPGTRCLKETATATAIENRETATAKNAKFSSRFLCRGRGFGDLYNLTATANFIHEVKVKLTP